MARILVCDDATDLRMLLRITLGERGHDVTEADGGPAALAELVTAAPPFDLLLLDVQMPEMDGWDVLSRVREDPGVGDLRVVVCTVKHSRDDLVAAWTLGADGYVSKPFGLDQLARAVDSALTRPEAGRAAYWERQLALLTATSP